MLVYHSFCIVHNSLVIVTIVKMPWNSYIFSYTKVARHHVTLAVTFLKYIYIYIACAFEVINAMLCYDYRLFALVFLLRLPM